MYAALFRDLYNGTLEKIKDT
ncbi:unnamed protein product, partial [Candida parapsilosis]